MLFSGNGDILSYEEANLRRKETGVSGLMIARWGNLAVVEIVVTCWTILTLTLLAHLFFDKEMSKYCDHCIVEREHFFNVPRCLPMVACLKTSLQCITHNVDFSYWSVLQRGVNQAVDIYGDQGAETLGHLVVREVPNAEGLHELWTGSLGLWRSGCGEYTKVSAGMAVLLVQVWYISAIFPLISENFSSVSITRELIIHCRLTTYTNLIILFKLFTK